VPQGPGLGVTPLPGLLAEVTTSQVWLGASHGTNVVWGLRSGWPNGGTYERSYLRASPTPVPGKPYTGRARVLEDLGEIRRAVGKPGVTPLGPARGASWAQAAALRTPPAERGVGDGPARTPGDPHRPALDGAGPGRSREGADRALWVPLTDGARRVVTAAEVHVHGLLLDPPKSAGSPRRTGERFALMRQLPLSPPPFGPPR
jgi:hypothetical protein